MPLLGSWASFTLSLRLVLLIGRMICVHHGLAFAATWSPSDTAFNAATAARTSFFAIRVVLPAPAKEFANLGKRAVTHRHVQDVCDLMTRSGTQLLGVHGSI